MPVINICEENNGITFDLYEQNVIVGERDLHNEVRISMITDDGNRYFIPVPTKDWPEFVRHCQKLQAVLA